jgi:hypothetical protein
MLRKTGAFFRLVQKNLKHYEIRLESVVKLEYNMPTKKRRTS